VQCANISVTIRIKCVWTVHTFWYSWSFHITINTIAWWVVWLLAKNY